MNIFQSAWKWLTYSPAHEDAGRFSKLAKEDRDLFEEIVTRKMAGETNEDLIDLYNRHDEVKKQIDFLLANHQ